jgi:hypothetical protein
MSNVTLTREQAKAIEEVKSNGAKATMISMHATNENRWSDAYKALNGMALDVLVKALYEGYDVKAEKVVVDPDVFSRLLTSFERKEEHYEKEAEGFNGEFYRGKHHAYGFAAGYLREAMKEAGITNE